MKKLYSTGIIAFVLLILNSSSIFAQDVIFKKNKEEVKCKVTEVGITEIKCKLEDNPEGPIFVFRKDDVWKIKYANGTETVITADKYSANLEQAILNKTKVIKFEIFSPLTGNITFGYEHVLKVGTNLEGKIGIIGPQLNGPVDHASGAFIKGGIKFLGGQDFYVDGMRYAHPLKGRYIRLELIYSSFTDSPEYYSYYENDSSNYHTTNNAFAMNICFGKQWILGNTLTLDTYFGVGYGFASTKVKNGPNDDYYYDDEFQYFYSHSGGTYSVPFALSGGIVLGYIL